MYVSKVSICKPIIGRWHGDTYIYEKRHISKSTADSTQSVQKRDITCTYVAELELFAKEWVLVWWCDVGNAGARA